MEVKRLRDLDGQLASGNRAHPFVVSARNGDWLWVATGEGGVLTYDGRGTATNSLTLPAEAGLLAVLPDATGYACWHAGGVSVWSQPRADQPAVQVAHRDIDLDGGRPLQLQFNRDGRRLWLATERPEGWGELHLLDPRTLSSLACAELGGQGDAGASLGLRPGGDDVLAEVSCGQDGSWITAVGVSGDSVQALHTSELDPHAVLGFDAGGTRYVALGQDELSVRSWPSSDELAVAQLPDQLESSWKGTVRGDCVYVVAWNASEESSGETELLRYRIADLSLAGRAVLGLQADVSISDVAWLSDECFAAIESQWRPNRRRASLWRVHG